MQCERATNVGIGPPGLWLHLGVHVQHSSAEKKLTDPSITASYGNFNITDHFSNASAFYHHVVQHYDLADKFLINSLYPVLTYHIQLF